MFRLAGLWLAATFALALATTASAACPANPYTLTNGTTADASQVMANFTNALSCAGAAVPSAGGALSGGTLSGTTTNTGTISGGMLAGATLSGTTTNSGTISGGALAGATLSGTTTNSGTISGGTLAGATLSGTTTNGGAISGGAIGGAAISSSTINGATLTGTTAFPSGVITSTGAVGIGTTSPASALDVEGTGATTATIGSGAAQPAAVNFFHSTTNSSKIQSEANNDLTFHTNNAGALTERMRLTTLGVLTLGATFSGVPAAGNLAGVSAAAGNAKGANLLVSAGNGRGSGGSGDIIFQTAPPGSGGSGTIAFDAVSTAASTLNVNPSTPIVWNHTVGAGGARILIVDVTFGNGTGYNATSITYAGLPLTSFRVVSTGTTGATSSHVEMWYILNPPSGTAQISVTFSGSGTTRASVGGISYSGVDQVTPFDSSATQTSSSTGATSASITTSSDTSHELLIDAIAKRDTTESITQGAGQTVRINLASINPNANLNVILGASDQAGSSSPTTMSWSWPTTARGYSYIVTALRPDGGNVVNSLTDVLHLTQSGNVGIATSTPSYLLHVNGQAAGVGAWINLSDARLKTNVATLSGGLDLVKRLRPVRFQWQPPGQRLLGKELKLAVGQSQLGFIAQEVQAVVPEAVEAPSKGPNGLYGLREADLIPVLVAAIKEQQVEIDRQQLQINRLENQIHASRKNK